MNKYEAKAAKAKAKEEIAKARAEVEKARVQADADRLKTALQGGIAPEVAHSLPSGVGFAVHRDEQGSSLVITGLSSEQLQRLVPQVSKEVNIAVTRDRHPWLAILLRFVREGLFQTTVKIAAGLIVGYLLFRFGLR